MGRQAGKKPLDTDEGPRFWLVSKLWESKELRPADLARLMVGRWLLADMDGDGNMDVVVGYGAESGGAIIWLGDGEGNFTRSEAYLGQGEMQYDPAVIRESDLRLVQNDPPRQVWQWVISGLTQLTTSGSADIPVCLNFAG